MKSPQPSRKPKPSTEPVLSPQEKLQAAQHDQTKWQAVAATPGLSPQAAGWAYDQARSAEAEVRLRQKAAAYQDQNSAAAAEQMIGTGQSSPQALQPCSDSTDQAGNLRLDK